MESPSGSIPGNNRALAPVAIITFFPATNVNFPSLRFTSTLRNRPLAPEIFPNPFSNSTLFFFSKCSTPLESCFATFRDLFTTFEISKEISFALKPNSSKFLSIWCTSDDLNKALVGIQPQFRQTPPRCSPSTRATFIPN